MVKYLIFGSGWLGNKFQEYFTSESSILIKDRIGHTDSLEQLRNIIKEHSPKVIINCIGKTGRPNVDWCEYNKEETFFSNVTIPTILAEICAEMDKYLVHIGSGCIYEGDDTNMFTEENAPNFNGSFYSKTKIFSEEILKYYLDNILIIRIRMPIDCMPSNRNLITKLVNYEKVIGDVPNSVTVIPDLLHITKTLINREETGIFNVVNNGVITHREILSLYKEIVNPSYQMPTFISLDELKTLIVTDRSNCVLSTIKLNQRGIKTPDVKDSLRTCLKKYKSYIIK